MVSIILPVYNGARYLQACIDSIRNQTYTDFELLIMDDGSTDDSVSIAKSFNDNRIKIFKCGHDFISTLNRGIEESKGCYLARIDCDDLMMPERLKQQVDLMDQNESIAVCATLAHTFGLTDQIIGTGNGEISHPWLPLLLGNYIIHPSVMIRKTFLEQHGIHYKCYPYAEDYKMWTDISMAGGGFHIIATPLINYRISESQVSRKHHIEQADTALTIKQGLLETLLSRNNYKSEVLHTLYKTMIEGNQAGLIDANLIFSLFHQIFTRLLAIHNNFEF